MARPLWSGTLSFGLVSIPIGVHTAVRDLGPHFHLLRAKDRSRIKYQKVAEADREPVALEDLVRGYEYEKGRYVVLTPDDFSRAALDNDRAIDVIDFVKAEEIDDRYFDKPYYLTPGPGGAKAYALLREAIRKADRVGVAKFVMRDKQHLAAIEAIGDALVLTTMRFREELVPERALDFPAAKGVRDKEVRLAEQLVHSLEGPWDPEKYTNEYRANLMAVIEAKRKHARPKLKAGEERESADVVDLMQRLRRSLGKSAGARPKKSARRATHRKRTKSKARPHRTRRAA